ncbi:MAG: hypothetical protein HFI85_00560 [Clostridia bacterium]|nr:hypothetical protein [Clostridia bacterium]
MAQLFKNCIIPMELECGTKDLVFFDAYKDFRFYLFIPLKPTDYAIACGADINASNECDAAIRNINDDEALCFSEGNEYGCESTCKRNAIFPSMLLDKKKLPKNHNVTNYGNYKTISFDDFVFPQSYALNSAEIEDAYQDGKLNATGRVYSGRYIAGLESVLQDNFEYEYKGNKYVRVRADKASKCQGKVSFEGDIDFNKGEHYWFKVEPIEFLIEKDENDTMLVRSKKGILSGVPFYHRNNEVQWQNSIYRVYLNGYDLEKEFEIGNGNIADAPTRLYNSEGCGFLEEADMNAELNYSDEDDEEEEKQETKTRPNPYGVSINNTPLSVKEQMRFYIDEGISFMLHGPSGVGKTRRVQELDPDCVCLQLRNGILPEEITGKTGTEGRQSFWIEPTWYTRLKELCENDPEHNHVLFIDELTNVRPNEQSLVFHLVLSRSIDGNIGKLPDNCVVVAAGNSPEESEAAYNMPEPLFRRFEAHIELKPDIKDFLEWGSEKRPDGKTKIHPLVAAFVAANDKSVFYTKYDTENPPKFAIDPRGWEQVSNIIYANKGELRIKMLADKIGESNAIALIKFASLPRITIEDILSDQVDLKALPSKQTEKYALTCSFKCVDEKGVKKVREFVKVHLGRENLEVFDSLWIENDDERAILINQIDEEEKKNYDDKASQMMERFKNTTTFLEEERKLEKDREKIFGYSKDVIENSLKNYLDKDI